MRRHTAGLAATGGLLVLLAGTAGPLNGQGLPRILDRIGRTVSGLETFIAPAPLTAGLETAVSGIGIAVLDLADIGFMAATTAPRDPDGVLTLAPGAWELMSESVSVLPGAAAPIQAEGFVLSPMVGPRAALVQSVLTRAYHAPDIALDDVQSVVWAIVARARISTLTPPFRRAADRLLTADERASLDAAALGELADDLRADVSAALPPALASIVIAESDVRKALADPAAGFADLVKLAVTSGEPESIMGDKDLLVERWSYHADGYFVRFVPVDYRKVAIHVVVPSGLRPAISRDAVGRVARVVYPGGVEIAAEYDNAIMGVDLTGDPGVRGYAFKTVSVSERDPNRPGERRTATVEAAGWALLGMPNSLAVFGTQGMDLTAVNPRYAGARDHYEVGAWFRRGLGFVGGDKEGAGSSLDVDPEAIDETYFRDAVGRAFATGAPNLQWARLALRQLPQAFDWVHCAMPDRTCQRADAPAAAPRAPVRFDPAAIVAVPGRQGSQRLAFTGRVVR